MSNSKKQVFITGGSGGLGLETARHFAGQGWSVCLYSRDEERLVRARNDITDFLPEAEIHHKPGDVLDYDHLHRSIREFASDAGGLSAVVHAAGTMRALGPLGLTDLDQWKRDLEVSLIGAAHLASASLPIFETQSGGAAFVAFVGPGHHEGFGFGSGFSTAQAGLVRLIENLALERKWPRPAGDSPTTFVGYYALFPAVVPTGLMQHVLSHSDGRKWLPRITELFGEGKEVEPQVPAAMAYWLCEQKPVEISGRVVSGMLDPELVEMRLAILGEGDKGKLRLKF